MPTAASQWLFFIIDFYIFFVIIIIMNISVKLHNAINKDLNSLDLNKENGEYKIEKNSYGLTIAYKNNRAVHSKCNKNG